MCLAEASAKTKLTGSDSVDHLERRAERTCKAGGGLFPAARMKSFRLDTLHCV